MALTATQQHEIYKIAVGLYNAAPGTVYMDELGTLLDTGTSVPALYDLLANTPSFQIQDFDYGTASTNQQFATQFVETLVGDTATQIDKDWASDQLIGLLNAGSTRGAVMKVAIDALDAVDESDLIWGAAAAQFHNRIEVATFYTEQFNGSATDIGILQAALSGVTDDQATVDDAIAHIQQTGNTFVLTDQTDSLVGTGADDTFIGVTDTFQPGDSIIGNAGDDTLQLFLDPGLYVATSLSGVENIELRPLGLSVSVTIDMSGWDTAVQNISIDRTQMDVNLDNAQSLFDLSIGSEHDISTHEISIGFTSDVATGTDDTFNVTISNFGTDTTDVFPDGEGLASLHLTSSSDVGVIESVVIDATGTNFVSLDAGDAVSSFTLTGGGTNYFKIVSAADTMSIDAGAATGDNTFDVGSLLSDGDTVIGGSGNDVLIGDVTDDTSGMAPTLTGVETVSLDFSASASSATLDFSLANVDDVGTVVIQDADSSGGDDISVSIAEADSDLTLVEVQNGFDSGAHDLSVAYSNTLTATADLTISFADDTFFSLEDLTTSGAASLTIAAEDTSTVIIDHVDFGAATTLNLVAGANADLDIAAVGTTDTLVALDALNVTVGDFGTVSADIHASDIGAIDATLGDSSDMDLFIVASLTSADTQTTLGDMTIGNINVNATADADNTDITVDIEYFGSGDSQTLGNLTVGDVTVAVGDSSSVDISISADVSNNSSLGDIAVGAISVTAGDTADVTVSLSVDADDSSTVGTIAVGDVSVVVGDTSSVNISLTADVGPSGTMGDMTVGAIDVTAGISADVSIDVFYSGFTSNTIVGSLTVGDVTVAAGDDSSVDIIVTASVSDTSTLGDMAVGSIAASATGTSDSISVDVGYFGSDFSILGSLTVGDVTLAVGNFSTIDVSITASVSTSSTLGDMTVGDITLTAGINASISLDVEYNGGALSDLGHLTVGDFTLSGNGTANVFFSSDGTTTDVIGNVDASGWDSSLSLDLSTFEAGGTIITSGAGDDTIQGTQVANVITGGTGIDVLSGWAGNDTFVFNQGDASRLSPDVILDFNTTGDDVLDLAQPATLVNSDLAGVLAVDYATFLTNADTALDATVRYYFGTVGTDGFLAIEYGGSGVADEVIQLTGVTALALADIA